MAFKKGHEKLGGRQKGVLNKRTETCNEICERLGVEPFEALLKMANHSDDQLAFQALKEICKYVYPQRKAVEHTGKDGGPMEISNPYAEWSLERLKAAYEQACKVKK